MSEVINYDALCIRLRAYATGEHPGSWRGECWAEAADAIAALVARVKELEAACADAMMDGHSMASDDHCEILEAAEARAEAAEARVKELEARGT